MSMYEHDATAEAGQPRRPGIGELGSDTLRLLGLWTAELTRLFTEAMTRIQDRQMPGARTGTPERDPARISAVAGRHLYRSRNDRMVRGVCAGLAGYLGLPVALVRLVFVLLAFTGVFPAVVPYVVLALLIPEAPWEEV